MKGMHMVAFILLVVGGLNWLLVGLGGWDLVMMIFGPLGLWAVKTVYILVGLSAIWEVATHKQNCKMCGTSMAGGMPKTM